MNPNYVLKEYYIRYLRDVKKLSESTVNHYMDALRYISKYLVERDKIENTIYELNDIGELEIIKEYLYHEPEFVALDKRGHQMYSAGLNNYYRFANGEGFNLKKREMENLDIEIPIGGKTTLEITKWKRSSIIKKQAIETANYKCEISAEHRTFIAESNHNPYMEAHHAIPYREQEHFDNSLDIYANIICLCPVCHRLLHYGLKDEKTKVLNQIYLSRSERLAHSGIKLSKEEFIALAQ